MKTREEIIKHIEDNIFDNRGHRITGNTIRDVLKYIVENLISVDDIKEIPETPLYKGSGEGSAKTKSSEAAGDMSVAEGYSTIAAGFYSHAEGYGTETNNDYEHAQGSFNVSHNSSDMFGDPKNTLHSVGMGVSNVARKNAFEIMQNGDLYILGVGGYNGKNAGEPGVKTLQQVLNEKRNS